MPTRLRNRTSALCAALCALLLATMPAAAQAPEPDIKKAEALIRDGKAAEAFALLEPYETKKAGDPVFDYLLATAALNSGQPSRAGFIYERILAVNPDYAGVRADMGRAYFAMGEIGRAHV